MMQLIITLVGYIVIGGAAYQYGKLLSMRKVGVRCLEVNKLCTTQLEKLKVQPKTIENVHLINRINVVIETSNYLFGIKQTPPDITKNLFEDEAPKNTVFIIGDK